MVRAEQFDLPEHLARWVPPIVTKVAVALAIIALTTGVKLAIDLFFERLPIFALIFPAIAGAVLLAGRLSGTIVLIGCQIIVWYFFIPIERSFRFQDLSALASLVLATFAQLILLWAVSGYRTAARSSADRDKRNADRMEVLAGELQHRTRNLLAMVQSIANRTLEGSGSVDEFAAKFRARLAALARVQGLLSRLPEGDNITFDELLRAELAAHAPLDEGETCVTLEGSADVRLHSSTIQVLALALHELTTNAVKYGALSQRDAHLVVRWHVASADDSEQQKLWVDWRESGVVMPETGTMPETGYGRELIEHALPYQLGAGTSYKLDADGVHCTLCLPIKSYRSTSRPRHRAALHDPNRLEASGAPATAEIKA